MDHKEASGLLGSLGERKLLSFTLVLFTLAIGVILGTMISTDAGAAREAQAAPDAKPLVIPDPVPLENEFSRIARQVRPSVVNIRAEVAPPKVTERREEGERGRTEDLFRRFFGLPEGPLGEGFSDRRRPGEGSGVIVDENGYIITNYHVIENADRIRVTLFDNGGANGEKPFEAKLIGSDPETDLAVVKIEAKRKLQAAQIGNSDAVRVGDWALAVGSPFGFKESVTVGIISARGRGQNELRTNVPRQFQKFLQTDAAINPGNSGGPLLNTRGEVIGINTAIVSRSGGYEGLGFALASNIAVDVYNQLIQKGRVTRGSIGISFREADPALLRTYGANDGGIFVSDVKPGGPAEKAGMKEEDVIVEINGRPVLNGDQLVETVAGTPVGNTVPVVVIRDGKRMTLQVEIADRAELFGKELGLVPDIEDEELEETEVMFGISVSNLSSSQREKLQLEGSEGVLVMVVESSSFAEDIGMQPNDVILAINRKSVSSVADVRAIQGSLKPGDDVAFKIARRLPTSTSWTTLYLAGVLPEPAPERF